MSRSQPEVEQCDEGHNRGIDGNGDLYFGCMPPIEEGPVIEQRAVGPWTAASKESA